jgi:threonylcarbamoyladenosine tRNA methylthiotransferase CDKAL1
MNQGEGHDMERRIAGLGHEIVPAEDGADVVVVNTCDVIDATERKILRHLRTLDSRKQSLIITGCMAAIDPDALRSRFPYALVVPLSEYSMFSGLVERKYGRGQTGAVIERGPTCIVPIAQGCLGNCAYCVTKLARGGLESYPTERIIGAVQAAVAKGAKEILLTAQDTGCYGTELGTSLPNLVRSVCEVEGDFRIRIGMMNPDSLGDVLDDTIEVFEHPKVYKFLHLPVQSGSDLLLASMGRRYDVEEFERHVARFRSALPRLTLSTDVITGFPGETDMDHRSTVELLRRLRPNVVNVTRFSPRPGTVAAGMDGQIVSRVSKDRSREITSLRFAIAAELNRRLIGARLSVTSIEKGKGGSTICRDNCYVPVAVQQVLPLGRAYDVVITDSTTTHVVGVVRTP